LAAVKLANGQEIDEMAKSPTQADRGQTIGSQRRPVGNPGWSTPGSDPAQSGRRLMPSVVRRPDDLAWVGLFATSLNLLPCLAA